MASPARYLRHRLAFLAAAAAVGPVAAAAALAGVRVATAERVLPRVSLAGEPLGGATREHATQRVRRLARTPVRVEIGTRDFRLNPVVAGRRMDVEATVDRLMAAGRTGAAAGLWTTATTLIATRDVSPVTSVDGRRLRAAVDRLAASVDRPPFPGAITVDSTSLAVTTRSPRQGLTLDRGHLTRMLRAALAAGDSTVAGQVRTRAAPPAGAVRAVAQSARRYLRQPLRVALGEQAVDLPSGRVAEILTLRPGRSDRRVTLGVDPDELDELLEELAQRTDRPPTEPRFTPGPGADTVLEAKRDATWRPRRARLQVRPGRSGRRLDRRRAAERVRRAIRTGQHDVRLPVDDPPPAVTTAQARRVRWLIGTFTTRYAPGQPRVSNIRRIARAIDGTVIPPGSAFSLNNLAGPRTRERGYVEAPFIADGRIVPSVGGGVSQFSTTSYNAAYFAGLPIDRYQTHSLFIDRYPAGRESTLNFPDIDLRWTNDTLTPIVVRTRSDSTSVTVALYGDNGGRRVRAIAGARRSVPGADFAITVTREIRYGDGRRIRQPITTTYQKPQPDR